MKIISYIILFCILLIGVSFAILNAKPVEINYFIATSTLPLSLLIVFSMGIGLVISFFFYALAYLKFKQEIHRLRTRVKLATKEVENLRVMPLKESH